MTETIEYSVQIAVLLLCTAITFSRALWKRSREWMLLLFFYGSWTLDDLFWVLCQIFFGHSPILGVVSDLSWYAALIFLYLLICQAAPPQTPREKRLLPWLGPVFTLAMAGFYMQWGDVVNNLIYAVLLGLLLFTAIRRLLDRALYADQTLLSAVTLTLCLLEYALWTASCFWKENSLGNPYYWFDFLLTLCFPLFLTATRKAVRE